MPSLSSPYLTQCMVLMAVVLMPDIVQDVLARCVYLPSALRQACSQWSTCRPATRTLEADRVELEQRHRLKARSRQVLHCSTRTCSG